MTLFHQAPIFGNEGEGSTGAGMMSVNPGGIRISNGLFLNRYQVEVSLGSMGGACEVLISDCNSSEGKTIKVGESKNMRHKAKHVFPKTLKP